MCSFNSRDYSIKDAVNTILQIRELSTEVLSNFPKDTQPLTAVLGYSAELPGSGVHVRKHSALLSL